MKRANPPSPHSRSPELGCLPCHLVSLALASVRSDANAAIETLLSALRHRAVVTLPAALTGTGVGVGAVAVVPTLLRTQRLRTVVSRPTWSALTSVGRDASAVVEAAPHNSINALASLLASPSPVTLLPRPCVAHASSVRQVGVLRQRRKSDASQQTTVMVHFHLMRGVCFIFFSFTF